MSVFDPKVFASMTFTGSNSTVSVPVPAGDWPFTIAKQDITAWTKRDNPNEGGLKLTLMLETTDERVKAVTERDKSVVRYECMLDLTPEGALDMGKGKNVRLGKLREAVGLNNPGQPFSFDMLVGRPVMGTVSHRALDDGTIAADCKAVARA